METGSVGLPQGSVLEDSVPISVPVQALVECPLVTIERCMQRIFSNRCRDCYTLRQFLGALKKERLFIGSVIDEIVDREAEECLREIRDGVKMDRTDLMITLSEAFSQCQVGSEATEEQREICRATQFLAEHLGPENESLFAGVLSEIAERLEMWFRAEIPE